MGAILGWILKQAAEGKFGKPVQALYLWLQGKKTVIAAILGVLAGALQTAQGNGACEYLAGASVNCNQIAQGLAAVAAFLALIGLTDGALRIDPPKVSK